MGAWRVILQVVGWPLRAGEEVGAFVAPYVCVGAEIKPWERHVAEKQVGGFKVFSDTGQRGSERVEWRESRDSRVLV